MPMAECRTRVAVGTAPSKPGFHRTCARLQVGMHNLVDRASTQAASLSQLAQQGLGAWALHCAGPCQPAVLVLRRQSNPAGSPPPHSIAHNCTLRLRTAPEQRSGRRMLGAPSARLLQALAKPQLCDSDIQDYLDRLDEEAAPGSALVRELGQRRWGRSRRSAGPLNRVWIVPRLQ